MPCKKRKGYLLTLNDITDKFGAPGGLFSRTDFISSSVKVVNPPRLLIAYRMNAALNAFSLEQEPHIIVIT